MLQGDEAPRGVRADCPGHGPGSHCWYNLSMSFPAKILRLAATGILAGIVLANFQASALPRTSGTGAEGSSCGSCHPRIHEQWSRSLHAGSTDDPVYRAVRGWAVEDMGGGIAKLCAGCHSVALAGSAGRTSSVDCRVCHQGIPGKQPHERLVVDPEAPVLVPRAVAQAPHAVKVTGHLASGAVCQPCHAVLRNPRGVTLCSTGHEAGSVPGPGCTGCHMGTGGHAFEGTSPRLLARAASLVLDEGKDSLKAIVLNRGAGHGLPTGSPLRQIHLEVRFLDASGRVLATHRAVFSRVFADAEGRAPAPPWRAASVARDTRLGRGERRVFSYPVPRGARRAEARLVFHRVPAKIVTRLGLADELSVRPVTMARAVCSLP